jgi:hypothetical protein
MVHRRMWGVPCAIVLGFVSVWCGCGSDSSSAQNAGGQGGAADAAPDDSAPDQGNDTSESGPTGETVTIKVTENNLSNGHVSTANPPIAGAVVAFDLPDGTRQETTTQADGTAVVQGVDWSKGSLALTVYEPKHQLYSWTGISTQVIEEWGGQPLVVGIGSTDPIASVQVKGTVSGSKGASDLLTIYTTGPGFFEA